MTSGIKKRTGILRRGAIGAAVLAIAAPMAMTGTAGAAQAEEQPETRAQSSDARIEVQDGSLSWGVRDSIRNYLENFGHTNGSVSGRDGAEYRKGDDAARFPVSGGWVDPAAGTASLTFDGRLDMRGFDAPWLHFEDLRLDIADGGAVLTVDMRESFGTRERTDDVVLSTFDETTDESGRGVEIERAEDGTVRIETGEGLFPDDIGHNHLPKMGGEPTYVGDMAITDPLTLTLNGGGDGGKDDDDGNGDGNDDDHPDPVPDPGDDPVQVPKGEPFGESTVTNQYGATLTVSPAYSLADKDQRVELTGTGFPTSGAQGSFGGLYVLFGWVDPAAGDDWGPGHGGATGQTYDYAMDPVEQGTYQSMVSYPGNTTVPGFPTMDANGDFEMEFPLLSSRFTGAGQNEIDCYRMQCGVILVGAHGVHSPEGEIFVPVYFTETADGTGNETPVNNNAGGPTANPNMAGDPNAAGGPAAQNGGLGVNGGLAAASAEGDGRTAMIGGLLLLSAGLLGAALVFRRRRALSADLIRPTTETGSDV